MLTRHSISLKTKFAISGILMIATGSAGASSIMAQGQRRPHLRPPGALLEVLDKDDRDCVTQSGLDKSVNTTRIRLANDRPQQILVRGAGLCLCGAQNCGFWIYRTKGGNYELLLKGVGATKVTAGRSWAHGYRDVVSQSHASAMETIIRTYRFDGSLYKLRSCFNRAYYDDDGKITKKPVNRPCAGNP